jgi:hypothetical protein
VTPGAELSRAPLPRLDAGKLVALTAALGISAWFYRAPALYPLALLGTMMHESGHAAATWLVGGTVESVRIELNASGLCLSTLPPSFFGKVLVYSAGYVGNAVAAAVLVVLTWRFRAHRLVLWAMVAWLAVMGTLHAGTWFTRGFCLGTALALGAAARGLPAPGVAWLNLFIAGYSVVDAGMGLWHGPWSNGVETDAQLLWKAAYVPPLLSTVTWTLASGAIVAWAIWYSVRADRG